MSSSPSPVADSIEFNGIGVPWWVRSDALTPALGSQLMEAVADYDDAFSRFRDNSAIAPLSKAAGSVQLPAPAVPLGALYRDLYELTEGAMTPFIGASLERLGYDARYSLRPSGPALPAPQWGEDVSWDEDTITSSRPVTVDVGAAGKGQLIDLLAGILRKAGAREAIIDASGDVRRFGPGLDRIGLEHPAKAGEVLGVVDLKEGAIAASASNRRSWGQGLHHVLNGLTGEPVRTVVATWVLAPEAMLADALATALFFVPGSVIGPRYRVEWLSVHSDGHAEGTPLFLDGLF